MSPKFLHIEDDTSLLVAANGTALGALLINAASVISTFRISIPTYPMWLYLAGLIFAFLSKAMIQLMNDDIRQRERLQNARDFLMEARKHPELTPDLEVQLETTWAAIARQHAKLLKEAHVPRLTMLRALFYFLSALCFLASTCVVIYQIGKLTLPE